MALTVEGMTLREIPAFKFVTTDVVLIKVAVVLLFKNSCFIIKLKGL